MSTINDSPLSITASVAGILTFLYAVVAGAVGYTYLFRSYSTSDMDIQRFYEAFSACALETDLVRRDILASGDALDSAGLLNRSGTAGTAGIGAARTSFMGAAALEAPEDYLLDPDSLGRLFEQVRAVEVTLQQDALKIMKSQPTGNTTLVGKLMGRGRWLSKNKELEASLGKREALTSRLLVIQMSLMSVKLRSQASKVEKLIEQVELSEKDIAQLTEQLRGKGQQRPNGAHQTAEPLEQEKSAMWNTMMAEVS